MAKETALTPDYFLGTHLEVYFHIKNRAETLSLDIGTWSLSFMVKKSKKQPNSTALIVKSTSGGITVTGVFNSDPALNTQRAVVTISESDTEALSPGYFQYELKRVDLGFEAVAAFGGVTFVRSVHGVAGA